MIVNGLLGYDSLRRPGGWLAGRGDPAPVDPSELTFLATDTRTPYVAVFDGADGNKVAHYMLCWESTRGEPGPWSETASATIGA